LNRDDDYRKQAAAAVDAASKAANEEEKASWLRLAQSWLMMIRRPNKAASDKFDEAEAKLGTHQKRSEAEH